MVLKLDAMLTHKKRSPYLSQSYARRIGNGGKGAGTETGGPGPASGFLIKNIVQLWSCPDPHFLGSMIDKEFNRILKLQEILRQVKKCLHVCPQMY